MKMAKVTYSLSKGFNRGDDDFAPAVEFDVSPRECVPYAEEYE